MEEPNLDYINEMAETDDVLRAQFIAILKEELPKEIKTYHDHINSERYTHAACLVHKLKHKIIILGLNTDYELAESHELQLKNNDFSFKKDFSDILDKMLKFVVELQ